MNPYHQIRERYIQNRAGSDDIVVHTPWSEDELAEAIRMRRAGASATAIGKKLKRTRNMVIGKLWRAGEPGVLANSGNNAGRWAATERPRVDVSMRFSEQRRVP